MYEYDDGSGPQQVERLADVPARFRKKAKAVEVHLVTSTGPEPAPLAEPQGATKQQPSSTAIVHCTYVTPGYHRNDEPPQRVQGTAAEVAKACREIETRLRAMCLCDNAVRGEGPIIGNAPALGPVPAPERPAAAAAAPKTGPATTIYCRRFRQTQLGRNARLSYEQFSSVGTLEEVKAACSRQAGTCSCSTDPAYFDQPRSCGTDGTSCVNAEDCCSGRCTQGTCRS